MRFARMIAAACFMLSFFLFPQRPLFAGQVIRVGIYENSPKVFTSGPGEPAGIFVDLIEEIASRENWEIEYVPGTWGEGLDRLADGKIDLMPDVAFNTERAKKFAFHSEPVLSDWFQIYSIKGSGIVSLLDLDGRKVSVLDRSIQEDAFRKLIDGFDISVEVVPFPDYSSAFSSVAEGSVDAVITNRFYGAKHMREFGLADTAVIFSPTRLFFAGSQNLDPALLEAIDKDLADMKRDPDSTYFHSLEKWTSEKYTTAFPDWAKYLGGAMLIAAILGLAGTVLFKRQVNVRSQELVLSMEARISAETSDRLKSAFLATMSHELRTPLNSIIGFTGIMLQGLAGPLNEEQTKQMGMIQKSARHLLELINDVLDISRIEAGRLELSREAFDPEASAERVIETVRPSAERKGLYLRYEKGEGICELSNDRRRFEQILINLLGNAVKFTSRGGVTLRSGTENGSIFFSVTDTGIGIRAEDLDHIFEPFKQVDMGKSREYEGTGLGLSICRKLVENMGGTIEARSQPGVGSEFTFRLPVSGGLDRTKILIIEDNSQNLYLMRFLLEHEGLEVVAATDGREGLEMASREMPDAILLDVQLPSVDGYAVAREMRKRDELAGVPIIAVTSYAMPDDRAKCIAAGATGYLEKPIDPERFVRQIREFIPGDKGSGVDPCRRGSDPDESSDS